MKRWEGMRSPWVLFAFALLGACKDKAAPERASPEDAAVAPPRTTPDASVAAVGSSSTAAPKKLGTEPNLLDLVPAKVSVSSTVANPRDFPEHLVDGRMDTAWNSATNDLHGFVAFRVPKDAHVARIEVTAGYDKVKGSLDLFRANHRIKKVRVSLDNNPIGDFGLDPNTRGLQAIPIDRGGGDYLIQVTETEPGTKKEWKELVVSELRVVGTPGKDRKKPGEGLRVTIGDLDKEPEPWDAANTETTSPVYPDIGALCGDYIKKESESLPERERMARDMGFSNAKTPTCAESRLGMAFAPSGPFKKLRAVRLHDGIRGQDVIVVETAKGVAMTPAYFAESDPLDPGCPSIVRPIDDAKSARVENGNVVILQQGTNGWVPFEDGGGQSLKANYATWCRDENTKLACRTWDAQYLGSLEGPWAIDSTGHLLRQGL